MNSAVSGTGRIVWILFVLARHGFRHAREILSGTGTPGPVRLRVLFEDLGGTFIKFGQLLSLQPDVLPMVYCTALSDLMDRVRPVAIGEIEKVFASDTGLTMAEAYDELDPQPIATASIGQVYHTRIGDRQLAVKIQRPAGETQFLIDLGLMTAAIALIRWLHLRPLYWLIDPTTEFIHWTREELDFRREAAYMARLNQNSEGSSGAKVPSVVWKLTARRVLTSDYLEGPTILDCIRARETGDREVLERIERLGFNPNRFARQVIENFLHDAFVQGIFHADPHPGNLIILRNNQVGYVDFGITGTLNRYSRRELVKLTLAFARGDLDGIRDALIRISAPNPRSDPEALRRGLDRLAVKWNGVSANGGRRRPSITVVMFDLLDICRDTYLTPEREVVRYIRSAITLDGLVKRFAPEFDFAVHMEAITAKHLAAGGDEVVAQSLWDGLFAATDALQYPVETGMSLLSSLSRRSAGAAASQFRLAAVVLVAACLVAFRPSGAGLGLNPSTVEFALLGCGLFGFFWLGRRSKRRI
jgi:ubiquinone biosynthesis protein